MTRKATLGSGLGVTLVAWRARSVLRSWRNFSILRERRRHDEVDNVGALLVLSVIGARWHGKAYSHVRFRTSLSAWDVMG